MKTKTKKNPFVQVKTSVFDAASVRSSLETSFQETAYRHTITSFGKTTCTKEKHRFAGKPNNTLAIHCGTDKRFSWFFFSEVQKPQGCKQYGRQRREVYLPSMTDGLETKGATLEHQKRVLKVLVKAKGSKGFC